MSKLVLVIVRVLRLGGQGTKGPAPAAGRHSVDVGDGGATGGPVEGAGIGVISVKDSSGDVGCGRDAAGVGPERRLPIMLSRSSRRCSIAFKKLNKSPGRLARPFCMSWMSEITAFPSVTEDMVGAVAELGGIVTMIGVTACLAL